MEKKRKIDLKNLRVNTQKSRIGVDFLSNHPKTESTLEVNEQLVLVMRQDWLKVIKFFEDNNDLYKKLMGYE